MVHSDCKVLIPACGQSIRYKEKTTVPKGLVKFSWDTSRTRPMLAHIAALMPLRWKIAVVCNTHDFAVFNNVLDSRFDVYSLNGSAGQADTVFQALRYSYGSIGPHEDFLVVNSDNAIVGLSDALETFRISRKNVGAVVFEERTGSEDYGFVDGLPYFKKGAEKTRLSNYALAGAFWFRSPYYFNTAYAQAVNAVREPRELYISALFEHVQNGGLAYPIDRKDLCEWGTWQQLESSSLINVDWSKQGE